MSSGQLGYNSGESQADEMILKVMGGHEITWGMRTDLRSKVWTLESSNVQMLGKSGWSRKGDQKGVATEVDAEPRW